MTAETYGLGIDPGWMSCGIALIKGKDLILSRNLVPKDCLSIKGAVHSIFDGFPEDIEISSVTIERFVAYEGKHSAQSENILMFIGALVYFFQVMEVKVNQVRAIDWKPAVCKHLVRTTDFSNPYPAFNKKYSLLAAEKFSGQKLETDHEADAVCLAYYGALL